MGAFAIGMMLALAGAAPSAEAEALGRRLAEAGTLGTLLPLIAARETEELIAAYPELGADEQALLRETAGEVAAAGSARIFAAEGRAYAERLSLEDLKALVAFHESAVAARQRAVQPEVIRATMEAVGAIDFKRETMAAFCARTGKGCEAEE